MYILGLDTATQTAGVALINDDTVISERFINNKLTHSQHLMPMVEGVLNDAGIKAKDLNCIAVTKGPGSFTGLRIGMTAAKTMAQVLEIPLVAVSTLDLIAYNLIGTDGLICPILNAKKGEVYTCLYRSIVINGDNELEKISDYIAIEIEGLIELIKEQGEKVTFLGDGLPIYSEELINKLGLAAQIAPAPVAQPRGSWLAWLGAKLLAEGKVEDPLFLTPDYIRASEAELTLQKKLNGCR